MADDDDIAMSAASAPVAASSSSSAAAAAAPATTAAGGTAVTGSVSSFLPWVEKYRPSELTEMIAQGDIVSTVSKLIAERRLPHLLFYGPPGTGKTTTILALARKLYGPSFRAMTLELNASDERGIDVVREQIKSFASTRKLFSSGVKLIILDEADAMTSDAQFALRRVIEKYTSNTRFCLLCNYVSKIIPALQSRCTRFRFAPLRTDDIRSRLTYVIDKEGIADRVSASGVASILRLADGDMRKVLNVLQATAAGYETVDEDSVYACTGNPKPSEMRELLNTLFRGTFEGGCAALAAYATRGYALVDMLTELSRLLGVTHVRSEIRVLLLDKLADIEYRLAFGTSEKLQGAALVAAFQHARTRMTEIKRTEAAGASHGGGGGPGVVR